MHVSDLHPQIINSNVYLDETNLVFYFQMYYQCSSQDRIILTIQKVQLRNISVYV